MDAFSSLKTRTKVLIVTSAFFLLTLSMGLLVFGQDGFSEGTHFLDQVQNAIRADLLYVHPGKGH